VIVFANSPTSRFGSATVAPVGQIELSLEHRGDAVADVGTAQAMPSTRRPRTTLGTFGFLVHDPHYSSNTSLMQ